MTHQAHDVAVATITAVSGLAAGLGAVLALKLARGDHFGQTPAVEPTPTAAYLPCHTTVCGHMTTPHDRTAGGLVCRGCGHTLAEVPHA